MQAMSLRIRASGVMTNNDKEMGRYRSDTGDQVVPDLVTAQRHLRAALEALSTDPDDYDKAAINLIWQDVLDATERLENMLGIYGTP